MRYFYDTEFRENGKLIDLVSIGIVAEDGREFYAVSEEFNGDLFLEHPWLVDNVLPGLPFVRQNSGVMRPGGGMVYRLVLDADHPDAGRVLPRWRIAQDIKEFLENTETPIELWANYGAYDHIALMQLWGPMISRPDFVPMFTHDIMQLRNHPAMSSPLYYEEPIQAAGVHNALADARHTRALWVAITEEISVWTGLNIR